MGPGSTIGSIVGHLRRNAIAIVALIVALSGTALATGIPAGSAGSGAGRVHTIVVPKAPKAPKALIWARVQAGDEDGKVKATGPGTKSVTRRSTGLYVVTLDRDVRGCGFAVTRAGYPVTATGVNAESLFAIENGDRGTSKPLAKEKNKVTVEVRLRFDGMPANRSFMLLVIC
jgi:hypothetical protein